MDVEMQDLLERMRGVSVDEGTALNSMKVY